MKLSLVLIFLITVKIGFGLENFFQGKSIVTVDVSPNTVFVPSSTTTTTVSSVTGVGLSIFTFPPSINFESSTLRTLTSTSTSVIISPNNALPEASTPITPALTPTPANVSENLSTPIPTPPPNAPGVILSPGSNTGNNVTLTRPQFSVTRPPDHEPEIVSTPSNASSNFLNNSSSLLSESKQEIDESALKINLINLSTLNRTSTDNNGSIQIEIQNSRNVSPTATITNTTSRVEDNLNLANTFPLDNSTNKDELKIRTIFNFLYVQNDNGSDLFGLVEDGGVANSSTEEFGTEEIESITTTSTVTEETEVTSITNTGGFSIIKSNKTTVRKEEITSYDEEYKETKS